MKNSKKSLGLLLAVLALVSGCGKSSPIEGKWKMDTKYSTSSSEGVKVEGFLEISSDELALIVKCTYGSKSIEAKSSVHSKLGTNEIITSGVKKPADIVTETTNGKRLQCQSSADGYAHQTFEYSLVGSTLQIWNKEFPEDKLDLTK